MLASLPLLRVQLLGDFRVHCGEHLVGEPEWKRKKSKTLFKLLLLAPGRALTREQAMELLWPESEPEASAKNLNTVLYTLRRALCPDPACPESAYVALEGERLFLRAEALASVDADAFQRQASAALGPHGDRRACGEAIALYTGDLLPDDLYEDWAAGPRERLRIRYLELRARQASLCERGRDYPAAIEALQRLLEAQPSDEQAHRALMRTYALAGRRHDALRQYQSCREALGRDLDVEPLPETAALYAEILAGRVAAEPAATPMPFVAPSSGPFVGRDAEIEQLEGALDDLSAGRARVVLLRGEMGIGKTRLAQEFLTRAAWHGALVLAGATPEDEGALPYAPLVEALRRYLGAQPEAVVRRHFGTFAAELVRLLPDLRRLAVEPIQPTLLEPALAQTLLFHALVQVTRSLAEEQPVVLFLDDAHAADQATLQLLSYLLRNAGDVPLLVLLAARPEELRPEHPLHDLVARWQRQEICLDVPLSPLSPATSAQLVSLLGAEARLATPVFAAAEGNPLYTQELVRAISEGGAVTSELPPRMREVLATRLRQLRGEAKEVLGLCAAIGTEFAYELARMAGGVEDGALLNALDDALGAGLIEEHGDAYRFRHGLMRRALYEGASGRRRVYWHHRIAEALEQLHAERLGDYADSLARHWEAAREWERALHYALQAAEHARQVHASEGAIQFYRQAESLLGRLPGGWTAQRLAAATGLGDALSLAGRDAEAEEQYRAALTLAPEACRAADLCTRLALTRERRGDFPGALAVLEEGRSLVAEQPPGVEKARLCNALGLVHNNRGDHRVGLDFTRQALAVLAALPENRAVQETRATALRQLGVGLGEQGEHEAALEAFGECLSTGEALGDEPLVALTLTHLGSLHVRRAEHARAVAYLERGLATARRVGDVHTQARCLVNLGDSFRAQGDAVGALPHLREAARLAEETGALSLAHYICGVLVATTLAQGDLEAAADYAQRAWAAAEALGNPRDLGVAAGLLGQVAGARREWDVAEARFAQAFEWLAAGEHRYDRAQAQRQHGEMLLARGERERGRAELRQAVEDFQAIGAAGDAAATEELLAAS